VTCDFLFTAPSACLTLHHDCRAKQSIYYKIKELSYRLDHTALVSYAVEKQRW
jgi:hypothetical protein